MRDFTGVNMQNLPRSARVCKRDITVSVVFAPEPGILHTLEGAVWYSRGDALITGVQGERWPVRRNSFLQTYVPVSPTLEGQDGAYRKKPQPVWAVCLEERACVKISGGELVGQPGDWLVQYGENDYGIVAADIFSMTYRILDEGESGLQKG